jgi:hypothetical protein
MHCFQPGEWHLVRAPHQRVKVRVQVAHASFEFAGRGAVRQRDALEHEGVGRDAAVGEVEDPVVGEEALVDEPLDVPGLLVNGFEKAAGTISSTDASQSMSWFPPPPIRRS